MRISTIIPAYNRANLIGETLRAVLAQSLEPYEVIVVDDGSTDRTADVAASFGKKVRLIRQANGGAASARNAGLAAARGDVVNFMDSDDLPTPNSYALAMRAISSGADFTYGPWVRAEICGRDVKPEPFVIQQGPGPRGNRLLNAALLVDWVAAFPTCLFRRSLIEEVGPLHGSLTTYEDVEFIYRILLKSRLAQHVPDSLLLYRFHPDAQLSGQDAAKSAIDRVNYLLAIESLAREANHMDDATRRKLATKRRKASAVLRQFDAFADRLSWQSGLFDCLMQSHYPLWNRVMAKWHILNRGSPYAGQWAAGRLTSVQRKQIAIMGYHLSA